MRVLLGIILGVILTVAGAYLYDSATGRVSNGLDSAAADGQAPLVNWTIVSLHWNNLEHSVRATAANLERSLKRHTG